MSLLVWTNPKHKAISSIECISSIFNTWLTPTRKIDWSKTSHDWPKQNRTDINTANSPEMLIQYAQSQSGRFMGVNFKSNSKDFIFLGDRYYSSSIGLVRQVFIRHNVKIYLPIYFQLHLLNLNITRHNRFLAHTYINITNL